MKQCMQAFFLLSRHCSLELTELSSINKVSLVQVSSCSNTGSVRDYAYRSSRKNNLELTELSSYPASRALFCFFLLGEGERSINKVSLVQVSSCSNTGSIRDYPYRSSRKNNLEMTELSIVTTILF